MILCVFPCWIKISTHCLIPLFSFFIGWKWAQQWATLLHWALLAWRAWPPDPRPLQWSPDPGAEVRSWVNSIPPPRGAGHRPGVGSFSEALGFSHCKSVCDRWKRQRSGLQLSICGQRHGGSACRVSGISSLFCHKGWVCLLSWLQASGIGCHVCYNNTFCLHLYWQVCDFVRDGSRWRWRRKWPSVIQNPGGQQRWSLQSEPQHW